VIVRALRCFAGFVDTGRRQDAVRPRSRQGCGGGGGSETTFLLPPQQPTLCLQAYEFGRERRRTRKLKARAPVFKPNGSKASEKYLLASLLNPLKAPIRRINPTNQAIFLDFLVWLPLIWKKIARRL